MPRVHSRNTMKTLLFATALFIAATFARADVTIEQKMESAMMNGNMTMKIKGDSARMDMPSPVGGNVTIIMNMKSGDMTTLMHAQKMAMKMNMNDAKKQAEAAQKAAGIDPNKIEKPKATGTKEKVGVWDTEIYEFSMGGTSGRIWVAKDFPDAQVIKDQMLKMSSAAGGGFDASKLDVPGMTVKTEIKTPVGNMTTTLVKVSQDPVAESEFALPDGYKEMKMPTPSGAK